MNINFAKAPISEIQELAKTYEQRLKEREYSPEVLIQ